MPQTQTKPKTRHPLLMNPTPKSKPNAALQHNELLEWNRMQHGEEHSLEFCIRH
jgi:hypothetical protein